jgi:hypothetical protein
MEIVSHTFGFILSLPQCIRNVSLFLHSNESHLLYRRQSEEVDPDRLLVCFGIIVVWRIFIWSPVTNTFELCWRPIIYSYEYWDHKGWKNNLGICIWFGRVTAYSSQPKEHDVIGTQIILVIGELGQFRVVITFFQFLQEFGRGQGIKLQSWTSIHSWQAQAEYQNDRYWAQQDASRGPRETNEKIGLSINVME